MAIGVIVINKITNGKYDHKAWLESKGFVVETGEQDQQNFRTKEWKTRQVYYVTVDGFLKEEIDLSELSVAEATEKLRSLTTDRDDGKKFALTYKTKVHLPGEDRPHEGRYLVGKLGAASALVMSEQKKQRPAGGLDW